jgi:hypothetical protein
VNTITASGILSFYRPIKFEAPTEQELELQKFFLSLFPEQEANFFSFLENRNCDCKFKLFNALNAEHVRAQELVDHIYKDKKGDPPIFSLNAEDDNRSEKPLIPYAGNVLEIEPTPVAFKAAIAQLSRERKVFSGLTVKDAPNGKWLLFLY